MAGGLELDDHEGPLQPKPFHDFMNSTDLVYEIPVDDTGCPQDRV